MNDKDVDKLIREALRSEQELPVGLSDRLERHIDRLAADEQRRKATIRKKRSIYWFGSIAASLIIGIVLFFRVEGGYAEPKDTFSDPREAAIAAQNALALLSTQLNKGLDQVSAAGDEVHKVNTIVDKQLEALHAQ